MLKKEIELLLNNITKSDLKKVQNLSEVGERRKQLEALTQLLNDNQRIIPIQGFLKLTKTENAYTESYLFRDLELEKIVVNYLDSRMGYQSLIQRYNNYDPSMSWTDWPKHYAVRILAGNGSIASGKNIFSFFPEALRLMPRSEKDVFGLEFIDAWENIFRTTIFPCVRSVFNLESQFEIYSQLEVNLSRTIYLAAVFHEMGHRCGPWKVSPHANEKLKLNSFHWGILGEISTDSLLSVLLEEFPEIPLFVTLQRLFWFGRRGFLENPLNGMTNTDNDSWLGSYLWNQLIEFNAIEKRNEKWILNSNRLGLTYRSITAEIDSLAQNLTASKDKQKKIDQNLIIEGWMKEKVSWDKNFGFIIPKEFRKLLDQCYEVPEQPHFFPPFSLSEFNENEIFWRSEKKHEEISFSN